jgi:cysteine desulfurase
MKQSATKSYYLDHAAATPLAPAVLDAMMPYLTTEYGNPSSLYDLARRSRTALDGARRTIADHFGAKTTEIVMTSGGTEGNNLAIQGVLRAFPGAHWVTSALEHDAVLGITAACAKAGWPFTVIPVPSSGVASAQEFAGAISDNTVLVSLMMANNEIGTIQPVADLAKLVTKIRADRLARNVKMPLYVHTDAVQAANYLDLHVARLGVDLVTISGSKIYGPKGTGCLYIRHGTIMEPLMYGGGQERGRRSGTENTAGIVGLAAALAQTASRRDQEGQRVAMLRDELARSLQQAIPGLMINGQMKRRLPNNLNVTIPGAEGEALVLYLDQAHVMTSTGSACSTGDLDPSHVLMAIGRTTREAGQSLRLTLGRDTTRADIDHVARTLPGIVARLRQL